MVLQVVWSIFPGALKALVSHPESTVRVGHTVAFYVWSHNGVGCRNSQGSYRCCWAVEKHNGQQWKRELRMQEYLGEVGVRLPWAGNLTRHFIFQSSSSKNKKRGFCWQQMPAWDCTHIHTCTHTHTHTHVGFYGLRGLSIGVMVFILYKLYVLLPYTYPTPKLSPHRRRCISIFPQKNSLCMIYKRFKLWGHWKCPHKSPSPCNTYVIPMSLYKFVSS